MLGIYRGVTDLPPCRPGVLLLEVTDLSLGRPRGLGIDRGVTDLPRVLGSGRGVADLALGRPASVINWLGSYRSVRLSAGREC